VDREQSHGVRAFFDRHSLDLLRADRLLVGEEPEEAFDVGAAQLLVRPRQAPELSQVGVPPATVPPREHREVVVVLPDDAVTERLEPEARADADEPVVALEEGFEEAFVARPELTRELALEPDEQRPPSGCPAQEDERVVRDADER
jgi:hypothetical protein